MIEGRCFVAAMGRARALGVMEQVARERGGIPPRARPREALFFSLFAFPDVTVKSERCEPAGEVGREAG